MLWTDTDEANERRLYKAGKSAFWLYPERWSKGPVMQFEEPTLSALVGREPSVRKTGIPRIVSDFSNGGIP